MALNTPPPGGGKNHDMSELLIKFKEMENLYLSLKEENFQLKNELTSIKIKMKSSDITADKQQNEFYTDEEELEKETAWLVSRTKKANKKRKIESSPELDVTDRIKNNKKHELKPPPIILSGTELCQQNIQTLLKDSAKENYTLRLIGKDQIKVNVYDSTDYRSITSKLSQSKLAWHSYENKQTRQIRVIAKNLHHTCQPEEIVEDLQRQGLKAISAFKKLKWKTKQPLNMFTLCFDATEDIKKIYEIKQILKTIIKIEPIKPSKLIPQCKTCQGYMHTKNYCCKPPKCVKCAGDHKTIDCTKKDNELPKCCNCGQNHPASYRGCQVAKELQKQRNKRIAGKKEPEVKKSQKPVHDSRVENGKTFAAIVAEKSTEPKNDDILSQILFKLNEQTSFNTLLLSRIVKLEKAVNVVYDE